MNFDSEMYMRAQYNTRALRETGIDVARAFHEGQQWATNGVDVLGHEYREGKLFIRLQRVGQGQPIYEQELHLARGAT